MNDTKASTVSDLVVWFGEHPAMIINPTPNEEGMMEVRWTTSNKVGFAHHSDMTTLRSRRQKTEHPSTVQQCKKVVHKRLRKMTTTATAAAAATDTVAIYKLGVWLLKENRTLKRRYEPVGMNCILDDENTILPWKPSTKDAVETVEEETRENNDDMDNFTLLFMPSPKAASASAISNKPDPPINKDNGALML